jgi:hypothetical protein
MSEHNVIVIKVQHPGDREPVTYLIEPHQTFVIPGLAREVIKQEEEEGVLAIFVAAKDFGLPERSKVTFGHLEQFTYGQQDRS